MWFISVYYTYSPSAPLLVSVALFVHVLFRVVLRLFLTGISICSGQPPYEVQQGASPLWNKPNTTNNSVRPPIENLKRLFCSPHQPTVHFVSSDSPPPPKKSPFTSSSVIIKVHVHLIQQLKAELYESKT